MAYVALYRQWRPQKFEDVAGQDHISKTLKNAIKANRIVHAYLFTGPRGTGKTSSAKILAKAVNCLAPVEGEACDQCEMCKRFKSGQAMDMIEIDAASNRGIDEIRDLREKVKYAPVEGKYKIYIIDEVHMLTTEAFNALLKTLEEPPKHVIFILATTEPHKVPITVLSRCQRFDFKRIGMRFIIDRLQHICTVEGLKVNDAALQMIAKKAEGSMRDALSLLDQCLSFSEEMITEETIASLLGAVDNEFIKNIVLSMAERDYGRMISLIDSLIQEGKDIRLFHHDLTEYFRNLILVKLSNKAVEKLDVPDFLHRDLAEQSKIFTVEVLFNILDVLSEGEAQLKNSTQPRITLELSLIRAARIPEKNDQENVQPVQSAQHKEHKGHQQPVQHKQPKEPVKKENVPPAIQVNIKSVQAHWPQVMELVNKKNKSTGAFLKEGTPVELRQNKIIMQYLQQFKLHAETIEKIEHKKIIEEALGTVFRQELTVQSTTDDLSPEKEDEIEAGVQKFLGNEVKVEIVD
ncbi:DNA polymerase III subunit gamma/tau [Dehalobacterium formicoaceticum]|uniref:DNA-directed DNA polymerase n=1 Tax=Dehalobacterium formicoaceticum TaxID=51515 RepID=A0ABT1YBK5_9FIRM|nr:DNA polymerase III subunit gamma/tau [Dehalobacterium formicoaceticum]MCR6547046.1 DNA polymerase III subunit gamma/tau [Dehalobacterium formicoaceticum]